MWIQHIHHFVHHESFSFLKDLLPILISSFALIVSVLMPYLLIRYDRAYTGNKAHKDFLGALEMRILDWLNVTSHNDKLIDEFLEVLKTPGAVFPQDFQFYDFPAIDSLKTYNNELLNEAYVQVRKLKNLDHHLRMISAENLAFRRQLMAGGGNLPANIISFITEALNAAKAQCTASTKELTDLRVRVRLLLNEANKTNTVELRRFFSFSQKDTLWYKKDMQFTDEQVAAEEAAIGREKAKAAEDAG